MEKESGQMQYFYQCPKALKKGSFSVKQLETNTPMKDFQTSSTKGTI